MKDQGGWYRVRLKLETEVLIYASSPEHAKALVEDLVYSGEIWEIPAPRENVTIKEATVKWIGKELRKK